MLRLCVCVCQFNRTLDSNGDISSRRKRDRLIEWNNKCVIFGMTCCEPPIYAMHTLTHIRKYHKFHKCTRLARRLCVRARTRTSLQIPHGQYNDIWPISGIVQSRTQHMHAITRAQSSRRSVGRWLCAGRHRHTLCARLAGPRYCLWIFGGN